MTGMKKILILCRRDDRPDYDQIDTYRNALGSIETKNAYVYGEFEEIVFRFDGKTLQITHGLEDICVYDGIFLIGWFKTKMLEDAALAVAVYARHHGVKLFNTEALYTRSRSKLSQYVIAALNNIPITPFLFCMDSKIMEDKVKEWGFGYPLIMKAVQASRGNDNYLVNSSNEAVEIARKTDSLDGPWFVLQGFVPNKGDLRMIVMNDMVKYVIHRRSLSGSHLNNTSKGGEARAINPTDLPEDVIKNAIKIAHLLRREITGVDMIQHSESGKYYLLEVNNMPQMATGSLVEEKMRTLDAFFDERI